MPGRKGKRKTISGTRKLYVSAVPTTSLSNAVNKVIHRNSELKYFTYNLSNFAIDASWLALSMSNIPQGDSQTTRDGNAVYLKGYSIKYKITRADTWQKFRVLVVRYLSPNTTNPAIADILHDVSSVDMSMITPNNFEKKKSYQILYDKLHNLQPDSGLPNYEMTYKHTKTFKKPRLLRWNTSGSADYESGNLTFFVISDSVATTHPSLSLYSRVTFIEK